MNTIYEQLKSAFQSFFRNRCRGVEASSLHFQEGEYWINTPIKNGGVKEIHYELIKQGNDFFIELHVETPARFVPQWESLRKVLDGDKRHFLHYTYYSSNYWRSRNPVVETGEVTNDLDYMFNIVDPVFANGTNAILALAIGAVEDLPFQKNPEEVAHMLDDGTLHLPAVQRGKVWNAARIETLWDSIFRGFSIGALLCVQKKGSDPSVVCFSAMTSP